jgi:hypothetical protein
MLADHDRQLLTAFVDGQLTSVEKGRLECLLQESEEARRLLRHLQEDAWALKGLPRVGPRYDLAHSILGQVHDQKIRPAGSRPPALPTNWGRPGRISPDRPFPTSVGDPRSKATGPAGSSRGRVWIACAAALLLLVCAASYAFFASLVSPSRPPGLAGQAPDEPAVLDKIAAPDGPERKPDQKPDGPAEEEEPVVEPGTLKGPSGFPSALAKGPPRAGSQPGLAHGLGSGTTFPPAPGGPILAGPGGGMELFNPETVEAVLPQIFSVGALDRAGERQKLLAALDKGDAFRVELVCTNASSAFTWVRGAFRDEKVGLSVDALAAALLKQPKLPVNYAIYAEGLTAEKLVDVLANVGDSHRKGVARKSRIDLRLRGPLVVAPLTRGDRKDLTSLLGFDPLAETPESTAPQPPRATGKPMKPDPREELSAVTARQVARALEGKGTPRPVLAQPRALTLVYPLHAAPRSAEVRQFREERKPLPKHTLRVFLVLRTVVGR